MPGMHLCEMERAASPMWGLWSEGGGGHAVAIAGLPEWSYQEPGEEKMVHS